MSTLGPTGAGQFCLLEAWPLERGPALGIQASKTYDVLGDFLVAQEAANGVAGLGAAAEPVLHALGIELDCGWLLERIVRPHDFDEPPVSRPGFLNDHDTVRGLFFLANTRKPNHQH
ncbi:MAG TPA: hypothetical protein VGR72_12080 [Candidatus Acidoferrales bacterium]|nr:hypothetical protein [Candidatus Acidoferrales bacterium]